jgi:Glycosyl transferases group 1
MSKQRLVHVLTTGFSSPNGCAFLMPLIMHRRAVGDLGVTIRFFERDAAAVTDCDILIIDSKYHSQNWAAHTERNLAAYERFQKQVGKVILADILDSSGFDHVRQQPFVTLHCKAQLLRDRRAYLSPLYGYRPYTDYYHRHNGVEDDEPVWSEPLKSLADLDKMTVGWNSALADYSWFGPYRMAAYRRMPINALLRYSDSFQSPNSIRPIAVTCRIGTQYQRRSIGYQRSIVAQQLEQRIETGKLTRRCYLEELRQSKVAISPFGLGEITLRDFEIFLSGAAMLKPDMSEIETWPDLYRDGETMVSCRWDMTDLDEKIDYLLSHDTQRREIAAAGQADYRKYLSGPCAGELFANHFESILEKCKALAA